MRASASSLLSVLMLCAGCLGLSAALAAAREGGPRDGPWMLSTEIYGPEDAGLGIGHRLGTDTWMMGGLWIYFGNQRVRGSTRDYESDGETIAITEFRILAAIADMSIRKDLAEWHRLRIRAGLSTKVSWARGKVEIPEGEDGGPFRGELTRLGGAIGPCLEAEMPLRGPLFVVVDWQPLKLSSGYSRVDGAVAYIGDGPPSKDHDRILQASTNPTILLRLRF